MGYNSSVQHWCSCHLDPTAAQRQARGQAFGCARVVFDDSLAVQRAARAAGLPHISDAALSAR